MALPEMTDALRALSLSDPEYLLFCPGDEEAWLRERFDDIPRYLFRVFTTNSRGTTDRAWTKSMDARFDKENYKVDIFARENKQQVASMLNRHLQWWEGHEDNLVSWTSSLLFALIYIFHLRANSRDGSTFEDIFLCIIDTKQFPKAVFLRDMDLIKAYFSLDVNLVRMQNLRSGDYYFGEYLSQGVLKIENKCEIVSAQDMIDQGLCSLRHEFGEFARWESSRTVPWAKPTVALRQDLYLIVCPEITKEKSLVAINIARLFGPRWQLPVAANLVALLPHLTEDTIIMQAFSSNDFTDDDRENTSPLKTKVIAYNSLPEVEKFSKVMRSIYKDFCVKKLKNYVAEAETQLHCAVRFAMNQSLERQDSALSDFINEAVKGQLDMEATVSQQLRGIIGSREAFP